MEIYRVKKQWILFLVIMITILLYAVFVIMLFIFKDEVKFQPAIFLVEYAKFLGTLTIAVLSFLAIHIYWENKKRDFQRFTFLQKLEGILSEMHIGLENICSKLKMYFEDDNPKDESFNELKMHFDYFIERLNVESNQLRELIDTSEPAFLKSNLKDLYISIKNSIFPDIRYIVTQGEESTDLELFWKYNRKYLVKLIQKMDTISIYKNN